jgi:hypothetical protein
MFLWKQANKVEKMETNTLNEYNELRIGDTVAERTVIAYTKRNERIVGDVYASWVAVCVDETAFHPYVVWTVVARPEGWYAEQGDYCKTLDEALGAYKKRGGE